jgi:putative redox protein
LIERAVFAPGGGLQSVEFEVELPPEFPPNYKGALLRVIDHCSVKRAIQSPPEFRVRISEKAVPALSSS